VREKYSLFYRHLFVVATAVLLGYALWRMLSPLLGSLEWAAVLAFLLHPLHVRLTRRLGGRASLSSGLLTGLTPFVIILPLSGLGLAFASQVHELVTYLRGSKLVPFSTVLGHLERFSWTAPIVGWLRNNISISWEQVQQWMEDGARATLQAAASVSGNVMIGVAGTLVGFFFMLILLFFLLRDGSAALGHLVHLIPLREPRRARLVRGVSDALRAVVFGTAATAVIEGAMVGVGFAFARLHSPVVFGVLGAFAALLPAVGISAVLVPAVVYLAFSARWGAAIFLAFWGVVIIVVEHLLRPLLTSRHGEVSSLATFIGAIGGVAAFGFIGLILGPVLLSLIVALVRITEDMIVRPE